MTTGTEPARCPAPADAPRRPGGPHLRGSLILALADPVALSWRGDSARAGRDALGSPGQPRRLHVPRCLPLGRLRFGRPPGARLRRGHDALGAVGGEPPHRRGDHHLVGALPGTPPARHTARAARSGRRARGRRNRRRTHPGRVSSPTSAVLVGLLLPGDPPRPGRRPRLARGFPRPPGTERTGGLDRAHRRRAGDRPGRGGHRRPGRARRRQRCVGSADRRGAAGRGLRGDVRLSPRPGRRDRPAGPVVGRLAAHSRPPRRGAPRQRCPGHPLREFGGRPGGWAASAGSASSSVPPRVCSSSGPAGARSSSRSPTPALPPPCSTPSPTVIGGPSDPVASGVAPGCRISGALQRPVDGAPHRGRSRRGARRPPGPAPGRTTASRPAAP